MARMIFLATLFAFLGTCSPAPAQDNPDWLEYKPAMEWLEANSDLRAPPDPPVVHYVSMEWLLAIMDPEGVARAELDGVHPYDAARDGHNWPLAIYDRDMIYLWEVFAFYDEVDGIGRDMILFHEWVHHAQAYSDFGDPDPCYGYAAHELQAHTLTLEYAEQFGYTPTPDGRLLVVMIMSECNSGFAHEGWR